MSCPWREQAFLAAVAAFPGQPPGPLALGQLGWLGGAEVWHLSRAGVFGWQRCAHQHEV